MVIGHTVLCRIELRRFQSLYTTLLPIYATHLPIEIQTNEKYTDQDTDTRSRSKNNQSIAVKKYT